MPGTSQPPSHANHPPNRPHRRGASLALVFAVPALLATTLAACRADTPTVPPAEPPTAQPTAGPPLVFGTTANYPPFEFHDDQGRLSGADIALAEAIGGYLGRPVELRDLVWEGLADALALGQIDAAIAAISVNPERAQRLDFSHVYYRGEDAVLGRADSELVVQSFADLAAVRVGVAQNTVHERALREQLVDTGAMPPANLVSYATADQAVDALAEGGVDAVLLDNLPAQEAARSGRLRVLRVGLNPQDFAIALAKGNQSLQADLNAALSALHADGSLAAIYAQYLLPDAGQPPAPGNVGGPGEVPGATPDAAACINGMVLVSDLTLDETGTGTPANIPPGTPFVKAWRVLNNGTCTWDGGYALVLAAGDAMGGEAQPLSASVAPGAEHTLELPLVAPTAPGTYRGFWQLAAAAGNAFGERLDVTIVVPAAPAPTPLPTQTPSAAIRFEASPGEVTQGEQVILSWAVQGAAAQYFYREGEDWSRFPVGPSGSRAAWPPQTTTYNLRVVMPDGSSEVRQLIVQVNPVPEAPTIVRFTLNPAEQLLVGACTEVSWQVNGAVTTVRLFRDETLLGDGLGPRGSSRDCPPAAGTVSYRLEAEGPFGTSRASRDLTVLASAPTPTSPPAAASPSAPPLIESFLASPPRRPLGQCFYLSWSVSGASRVQLRRGTGTLLDFAPLSGNTFDCPLSTGTINYRLEAVNAAGQSSFADMAVTVTGP